MNEFCNQFGLERLSETDRRMLNPLKLAFLGDAVFEVYVRTYLLTHYVMTPHEMSKKAITYVKASAQAYVIKNLMPYLEEDEVTMVKRGRNQKSGSVPKNAALTDYRYATGFESLMGYLYLQGHFERTQWLSLRAIEIIDNGIETIQEFEEGEAVEKIDS